MYALTFELYTGKPLAVISSVILHLTSSPGHKQKVPILLCCERHLYDCGVVNFFFFFVGLPSPFWLLLLSSSLR